VAVTCCCEAAAGAGVIGAGVSIFPFAFQSAKIAAQESLVECETTRDVLDVKM